MPPMSDDSGSQGNPFGGMPFFGNLGGLFGGQGLGGPGGDPWAQARQIAGAIATGSETEPNVDPADRIAYEQLARVAELHVNNVTGLRVSDGTPPVIRPATRHEWALNTIDAYRPLLETMGEAITRDLGANASQLDELGDMGSMPEIPGLEGLGGFGGASGMGADFMKQIMSMLGPTMLAMTAGSMVGNLSRSNLGSYDLPLPRGEAGELLVVHANLVAFTDEWSVPVDDVRMWICLHTYVHHAVMRLPHVSERLAELTSRYVDAFESNPAALGNQLGGFDPMNPGSIDAESMDSLEGLMNDPEALMGVMQSDRQRAMLPEISALLAAIVGWADHMMDQIGTQLIGSFDMLAEAARRRRVTAGPSDRFLERMLGLELDQTCYDRGRAFVDGVIERGGEAALQRLWHSAQNLPTPNDIDAPGLWLARIDIDQELGSAGEEE